MPSRNVVRRDAPAAYYHVYARGISKANIFLEAADKDYFLYLMSRHLSLRPATGRSGYQYPHYRDQVELLSFCLMDNHFHLLFYQEVQGMLSALMKSIMVAYTTYFNRKYGRTGPLFESRFKAALVDHDSYLLHVSRYIHLNPRSWKLYPYSSLKLIRKAREPEWLQTTRLLAQHYSREAYFDFVADYEENKKVLDELKYQLADW